MTDNTALNDFFKHCVGQIEEAVCDHLGDHDLDCVFSRLNSPQITYDDVIPLWTELSAKRDEYDTFQQAFDSQSGYLNEFIQDGDFAKQDIPSGVSLHAKFNDQLDYGARLADALRRVRGLYEQLASPQEIAVTEKLSTIVTDAVDQNMIEHINHALSDRDGVQRQHFHDAIIDAYPDIDFSAHFDHSGNVSVPEDLVTSIDELVKDVASMRKSYMRFGGFIPEAGKAMDSDVVRAAVAQKLYAQNCVDFEYLASGYNTFVALSEKSDRILKLSSFDCDPFPELSQSDDVKPYVFPKFYNESIGNLSSQRLNDKAVITIMPRALPLEELKDLDGGVDERRIAIATQIFRDIADNVGLEYDVGGAALAYEERFGAPLYDGNNLLALLDDNGNLVEKDIMWNDEMIKVPVVYLGDADGISRKPPIDNGAVAKYNTLYFDVDDHPAYDAYLNDTRGVAPAHAMCEKARAPLVELT